MKITFCELRAKEVINVFNGKRLGNIVDMVIDTRSAKVLGIVVPNYENKFRLFKNGNDLFIPYCNIVKIGKDVILVDISNVNSMEVKEDKKDDKKPKYTEEPYENN